MTNFLIITSSEDIASMNIRDKLLNSNSYKFEETKAKWHDNLLFKLDDISSDKLENCDLKENKIYLGLTSTPLILLDDLKLGETSNNFDILIFASRHASKTARPAFLTHPTGNWGPNADFGGNPRELSHTSALLLKAGIVSIIEHSLISRLPNFSRDIEVTHHGPTNLIKPLIFMELGSNEVEWHNTEGGIIVSNSIINSIDNYFHYLNGNRKSGEKMMIGVGFGGPHYGTNFFRLVTTKNVAISHICPKYHIHELTKEMIAQMIEKTMEKVDFFVIDWKGTNSQDKKHLIPILEEFDIPIKKTKDFT